MESQPQNPEFRINPENFQPCMYNTLYERIYPVPRLKFRSLIHFIQKVVFMRSKSLYIEDLT